MTTRFKDSIKDTDVVTIVGGGLSGALMAVFLARRGFRVEVYERWGDPRADEVPAGRSINLALAERGIHALAAVGLHHRVGRFAIPMRGRMVHDREGETNLQPYGQREGEVIYSVHRARLNLELIEAAEATDRVRVHFNQELTDIDFASGEATFLDRVSQRKYRQPVAPLIAADGAGSLVRGAMERHLDFKASSDLLDHGYRELTVPPDDNGDFRIDPNALHIWPRGGYMMIALPNSDGTFTATLFLPNQGQPSFESLSTFPEFATFIGEQFPDAVGLLPRLERDFTENPVGVLGTVRSPRWHVEGSALLIGDAAHAIVPFHGQGMNCGFEDCEALAEIIDEADHWSEAFACFQEIRRINANAIADMALENYVEMRASVADPGYLLRRELALELERRFPEHFIPRYSMVMFRCMPYVEAQRRGRINSEILHDLTRTADTLDDVDFDRAAELVRDRLPSLKDQDSPTVIA